MGKHLVYALILAASFSPARASGDEGASCALPLESLLKGPAKGRFADYFDRLSLRARARRLARASDLQRALSGESGVSPRSRAYLSELVNRFDGYLKTGDEASALALIHPFAVQAESSWMDLGRIGHLELRKALAPEEAARMRLHAQRSLGAAYYPYLALMSRLRLIADDTSCSNGVCRRSAAAIAEQSGLQDSIEGAIERRFDAGLPELSGWAPPRPSLEALTKSFLESDEAILESLRRARRAETVHLFSLLASDSVIGQGLYSLLGRGVLARLPGVRHPAFVKALFLESVDARARRRHFTLISHLVHSQASPGSIFERAMNFAAGDDEFVVTLARRPDTGPLWELLKREAGALDTWQARRFLESLQAQEAVGSRARTLGTLGLLAHDHALQRSLRLAMNFIVASGASALPTLKVWQMLESRFPDPIEEENP